MCLLTCSDTPDCSRRAVDVTRETLLTEMFHLLQQKGEGWRIAQESNNVRGLERFLHNATEMLIGQLDVRDR